MKLTIGIFTGIVALIVVVIGLWFVSPLATLLGGILFAIILVVLGLLVSVFILARRNLFFTIVPEGQAKAVIFMGGFRRFVMQWKNYTFDERWNVVEASDKKKHLFGGLRWIGIWPFWKIYTYEFSWTGVDVNGALVPHKKEPLDYILLVEDVYWCKLAAAEDKNLLPLDIELLVTMKVVNPYRALFRVQNWSEAVMNRMKPLFREYVASVYFADLVKKKQESKAELYQKLAETGVLDEFNNDYGIQIRAGGIEIKNVDPTPVAGIPSVREITLRKYIAEQDRERILVEAEAEQQRLGMVAKGEEARIKTVYKAVKEFGELGKLLRTLEAVEKSPLAASLTVQAVPGLPELLKGVFGTSEVSKFDIQELIREIKKMKEE